MGQKVSTMFSKDEMASMGPPSEGRMGDGLMALNAGAEELLQWGRPRRGGWGAHLTSAHSSTFGQVAP